MSAIPLLSVADPRWRPAQSEEERRGRRARRIRKWLGYSQSDAAFMTWRTRNHVSRIESGGTKFGEWERYRRELLYLGYGVMQRREYLRLVRWLWEDRHCRARLRELGVRHPEGRLD